MARTQIPRSDLNARTGKQPTFVAADPTNGMQWRNTGTEVIVLATGTNGTATITFPSVPDPYNRTGDVGPIVQQANAVQYFGPFGPPSVWGDGATLGLIDLSGVSGSVSLAVIGI